MSSFGTTAANLKASYDGEDYETVTMYPGFAAIAEEEGYPEIAAYFRAVGNYERMHRDEYRKALDASGADV